MVEAFGRSLDVRIQDVRSLSELEADTIVVAAGAETATLVPTCRSHVVTATSSTAIRSETVSSIRSSCRAEKQFAAKQLANGRVLASDLVGALEMKDR